MLHNQIVYNYFYILIHFFMKKLSLFSLFWLAGLLAFFVTPIYAQDVEDDVSIAETSYNDEFDYGVDEDGIELEAANEESVDLDEASINLDEEVDFTSLFENEEVKNVLGELDMSNEEAAWLLGLFAWLGTWLLFLLWTIGIILWILRIIALWKAFERAWEWWWKAIIPVYCSYIKYKLAGMKNWFWYALLIALIMWIIAAFIPDQKELISDIATLITWIIYIFMTFKFARKYGWGVFTSVLFVLFYPICILILGFGNYKYEGKEETVVEA